MVEIVVTQPRPILFLDVDGVLNPFSHPKPEESDWKWELPFRSKDGYTLLVSKEMAEAIQSLGCRIVWLTTWEDDAHTEIAGPVFGWPQYPVKHIPLNEEGHKPRGMEWKLDHVRAELQKNGPAVVWIDDDANFLLRDLDDNEVDPFRRLVVINPDPNLGVTREELEDVRVGYLSRAPVG